MNQNVAPRIILPKFEPGSSASSPTLNSGLPTGDSASKRRCISSACMPCRKRKSKCDGGLPKCSACNSVYNSACYYDIDSDHRRKGALKRDIRQLQEEVNSHTAILDALRSGSEPDADDIVQLIRGRQELSYGEILVLITEKGLGAPQNNKKPEPPSGLEAELADISVASSRDKLGETSFYGHTSHLAFAGPHEESYPVPGDQLGSWTDVTNDKELINHLFDVYFAWSHPIYLMFPEEIFFQGLRDKKLKYCTPLLVNAILAVGCHFSDRPEARTDPAQPNTAGERFFAEAKRLLLEDDRPCLTTVQALGLMSLRMAMNNQDSKGWQYVYQMMGMAVQLGLHISCAGDLSGKITAFEIEARRVTFWGCFVMETVWSLCVGRISSLPRNAIRLEKPSLRGHLECKKWKPDGNETFGEAQPLDQDQQSYKYSILVQLSLLSEIVDDVLHMFYAPTDRITGRKLMKYHETFQKWYKNLPAVLAVKTREGELTLPQVLSLHMYYHNCIIHLYRPFLKVSIVDPNAKLPRQICYESADMISNLLSLYTRTYGMRRLTFINIHNAISASIIHLVKVSTTQASLSSSHQAQVYIAEAIRILHISQQTYPLAERYLKAIRGLIYKWCPVIPPIMKEAMMDTEMGTPSATSNDSPISTVKYEPVIMNGLNHPAYKGNLKSTAPPLRVAPQHVDLGNNNNNTGVTTPTYQQNLFWTPFPEALDGVPLAPRQHGFSSGAGINITSLLDSGIDGDLAELNRDGFTMNNIEPGTNDALWSMNWE